MVDRSNDQISKWIAVFWLIGWNLIRSTNQISTDCATGTTHMNDHLKSKLRSEIRFHISKNWGSWNLNLRSEFRMWNLKTESLNRFSLHQPPPVINEIWTIKLRALGCESEIWTRNLKFERDFSFQISDFDCLRQWGQTGCVNVPFTKKERWRNVDDRLS